MLLLKCLYVLLMISFENNNNRYLNHFLIIITIFHSPELEDHTVDSGLWVPLKSKYSPLRPKIVFKKYNYNAIHLKNELDLEQSSTWCSKTLTLNLEPLGGYQQWVYRVTVIFSNTQLKVDMVFFGPIWYQDHCRIIFPLVHFRKITLC